MNENQSLIAPKSPSVKTDNVRERCPKNHGFSNTDVYGIWKDIKKRCYNPNSHAAARYKDKGICMFEGWIHDPVAFIEYMGPRPSLDHSVDRWPNRNGNYEPGNVRWATDEQQNRNKDGLIWIEFRGEKMCVAELAEKTGLPYSFLRLRIGVYGWDVERAVNTPAIAYDKITYQGKEYSQRGLVREHGAISFNGFQDRIKKGWGLEEALKTPSIQGKKNHR